jgi:hypothetical protein
MQEIHIGQTYQHYKTKGLYTVINLAKMQVKVSELDMAEYVVYRALSDDLVWVRPVADFLEEVEFKGEMVKRFTLV